MKRLLFLLVICAFVFSTVSPVAAAPAERSLADGISGTYFSLYRYNGPLYVDAYMTCSYGGFLAYYPTSGGATQQISVYGRISGSYRFWPSTNPNVTYRMTVGCYQTPSYLYVAGYSVWYSGNTIRASRVY